MWMWMWVCGVGVGEGEGGRERVKVRVWRGGGQPEDGADDGGGEYVAAESGGGRDGPTSAIRPATVPSIIQIPSSSLPTPPRSLCSAIPSRALSISCIDGGRSPPLASLIAAHPCDWNLLVLLYFHQPSPQDGHATILATPTRHLLVPQAVRDRRDFFYFYP